MIRAQTPRPAALSAVGPSASRRASRCRRGGWPVTLVLLAALLGCGPTSDEGPPPAALAPTLPPVITLGDIDPDTPARRIANLQPLADYLAARLARDPEARGRVRVARSIDELCRLLESGEIDLYLDSAYPTVLAQERTGSEIVLLRRARGAWAYHSLILTQADSGVEDLAALRGRTVAFQEPYSTSGFLLPASLLLERGLELQPLTSPEGSTGPTRVGYVFSGDEENTLEMILAGRVAAGGVSNQDYDDFPAEVRGRLRILARSRSMPRYLVSVGSQVPDATREAIVAALLRLDDQDRRSLREAVGNGGWTWQFAALDAETLARISELAESARSLPGP